MSSNYRRSLVDSNYTLGLATCPREEFRPVLTAGIIRMGPGWARFL